MFPVSVDPPPATPAPCAIRCKDGHCISGDKVCDFFPDCAQRGDATDLSDEKDCDQCNFEKGMIELFQKFLIVMRQNN